MIVGRALDLPVRGYPDFRSLLALCAPTSKGDPVEFGLGQTGVDGESNERLMQAGDWRAEDRSVDALRLEELTQLDGRFFDGLAHFERIAMVRR